MRLGNGSGKGAFANLDLEFRAKVFLRTGIEKGNCVAVGSNNIHRPPCIGIGACPVGDVVVAPSIGALVANALFRGWFEQRLVGGKRYRPVPVADRDRQRIEAVARNIEEFLLIGRTEFGDDIGMSFGNIILLARIFEHIVEFPAFLRLHGAPSLRSDGTRDVTGSPAGGSSECEDHPVRPIGGLALEQRDKAATILW